MPGIEFLLSLAAATARTLKINVFLTVRKFAFVEPRCRTSLAWATADESILAFESTPTDSNGKPPEGLGLLWPPFYLAETPGSGPIVKDTRTKHEDRQTYRQC